MEGLPVHRGERATGEGRQLAGGVSFSTLGPTVRCVHTHIRVCYPHARLAPDLLLLRPPTAGVVLLRLPQAVHVLDCDEHVHVGGIVCGTAPIRRFPTHFATAGVVPLRLPQAVPVAAGGHGGAAVRQGAAHGGEGGCDRARVLGRPGCVTQGPWRSCCSPRSSSRRWGRV